MNHPKQNPRSKVLLLLLVLGCAALLATGTYAAYISHGSLKRVAVARTLDTGGMRFSSNYLFPCDLDGKDYQERSIGVTITEGSDVQIGITVCNYPQSSNATFNDKDISYTVTASCEGVSGISIDQPNGTLEGGMPSSHIHTIKIPKDVVNAVIDSHLTVVVTPNDARATQNQKLAAKLKLVPTEAVATGWEDQIMFEGASEKNDAINYYIHGTEECDMTLRWGSKIELGQWSRESLKPILIGSGANYITIHVGGPGQPTSYYLQFYRKAPATQNETKESLGISFVKGS